MNRVELDETGERMLPWISPSTTFWEHIYRYRFAARLVRRRRVLDVACGEGYGAEGLRLAGAAYVIGVDSDEATCRHAARAYGFEVRPGDCLALPLEDRSVDVVVSFETVEHLVDPERFVAECRRVLAPGGRIVISTPNRYEYLPGNPFHRSEMTRPEFEHLIGQAFDSVRMFGQAPRWHGWWESTSLFAENTPLWPKARLTERFRQRVTNLVLGPAAGEPAAAHRRHAPQLASGRTFLRDYPSNPYVVRPLRTRGPARPLYLLAVAQ